MTRYQAPTAEDVGRRAGVSRMTVSSVLNGTGGNVRVSAVTRARVIQAAAELGYVPNPAARALRTRRSNVIGFVPRPESNTPHKEPVADLLGIYIARAAMARGHHVVEASAETSATRGSDERSKFLLGWRVDGIIFDSPSSADEVQRFVDMGVPVIQIMRPRTDVATATITVDSSGGIHQAVAHLAGLGHRSIAYIGSGESHPTCFHRRSQFLDAAAACGLEIQENLVHPGHDASIEDGFVITRRILGEHPVPTAIFTAGDNLALGALRALYQAHLRVPDDISVISYDDTFVANLYPPLTSVAQPLDDVATAAVSFITKSAHSEADRQNVIHAQIILPAQLNVRESTGAPPMHSRVSSVGAVGGGDADY